MNLLVIVLVLVACAVIGLRIAPRRRCLLVVLGSGNPAPFLIQGGHSAEMFRVLANQPVDIALEFVAARGDVLSKTKLAAYDGKARLYEIARPRYVGQSYWSAPFTTLYSMLEAGWLLVKIRPAIIICNGPAISVSVGFIGKFLVGSKVNFLLMLFS